MILNQKSITLSEAKSLVKNLEENKVLDDYFKKFAKLSQADAVKLVDDLRALNNIKLKEDDFVKLADFLPQDSEELSKVISEVSLTEEEAQAILALIKKY